MERERIISLNPLFTKLLDEEPEGGYLDRTYPMYTSADDPLPRPQVLEPAAVLDPGDETMRPEKWPHRNARPMLALGSGPIPVFRL
jgi:hypothetical protein